MENKVNSILNASQTKDEKSEQTANQKAVPVKMESSESDGQCKVITKERDQCIKKERLPISFRQSPRRAKKWKEESQSRQPMELEIDLQRFIHKSIDVTPSQMFMDFGK